MLPEVQTYSEFDVEAKLASLSLVEKINLLGGQDLWHTYALPAKGIPPLRLGDGPSGVRGTKFFNGVPSNAFPCAAGIGSSFDVDLAQEIGVQLGNESKLKSTHVSLGPTINIQRNPLNGRGFEAPSEDPCLSGMLAAAHVNGVQSTGVAACLKHFIGNEQEFQRYSSDSIIPERALREIYLEPFRIAQKLSSPKTYMTSYNRVNGTHASENKALLDEILRKEWGFDGAIISDWAGVYSVDESIKAGLDLEMPGPPLYRGRQALRAVQSGKLKEREIDARVRKVLELINYGIRSGIAFDGPESGDSSPEVEELLRRSAADSIVLLKNEAGLLPINKQAKRIAVIGGNARVAVPSGGGSASLACSWTVSPLEGIIEAATEYGASVKYSIGCASYRYLPPITKLCKSKEGMIAQVDFWLTNPGEGFDGKVAAMSSIATPYHSTLTNSANIFMMDNLPNEICTGHPYVRWRATFSPDLSGPWEVALGSSNYSRLFLDGELIINNTAAEWLPGEMWFNKGSAERRTTIPNLVKGTSYQLEVRAWYREDTRGSPYMTCGGIRVGALPSFSAQEGIDEAVKVASECDLAIVVVGLNEDFESEGFDRKTIDLPGASNDLVEAILKVNPNTVIVNQSGSPVSMPWINQASTVVQAFYGGNALGSGLADILFGKRNPSAKLPMTFPVKLSDVPSSLSFGISSEITGKTIYTESIYVGYRYFQKSGITPLFPFGHGLSYTTFSYSSLSMTSISPEGNFSITFTLKNTGKVEGREIVQVYVSDLISKLERPVKELKAFRKISLKPGESKVVSIDLTKDALKYWDDDEKTWLAEAGDFEVLVGGSSEYTPLIVRGRLEKSLRWLSL